jgi:rubrerythrin
MSQTYEFYADRAREAADEAAAATLANVRERHERAAKTWIALAEQARSVKAERIRTEETKAALRAAEAAALAG